jgi:hypothetical protein
MASSWLPNEDNQGSIRSYRKNSRVACNSRTRAEFEFQTPMTEFHIREAAPTSPTPKIKPTPKTSKIPGKFFYAPSDDGTDENLLILLHGLGMSIGNDRGLCFIVSPSLSTQAIHMSHSQGWGNH